MKDLNVDDHFQIKINRIEKASVYLSGSWRPDKGQDVLWHLVKELDGENILVVGDVPDLPQQDDERIRRIMRTCAGFVVVLPFREQEPSSTSTFIIRELRIAASLALPVLLFREARVPLSVENSEEGQMLTFSSRSDEPPIALNTIPLFGPFTFDEGSKTALGDGSGRLTAFTERVIESSAVDQPYAFLDARLQRDFEMVREAIIAAVQNTAGTRVCFSMMIDIKQILLGYGNERDC